MAVRDVADDDVVAVAAELQKAANFQNSDSAAYDVAVEALAAALIAELSA